MTFDKLTEEDVKFQYITPAIQNAGWSNNQFKFEYSFTDGEIQIRGDKTNRGPKKRADYLLLYKPNLPIAIVEAKDQYHSLGDGIQQAVDYANILDIPFAFSSNGTGFLERDRINGTEREISLDEFPSPEELWERYKLSKEFTPTEEKIVTQPYYYDINSNKEPRYYQRIAINRTIEAIAKGQNRILLVMATGTGKTFTAFQIAHRLKESGLKKKILYLADRNILIDQTMDNDFKPFEKVMTKIENKEMDSSYELYFALYQQLVDDKKPKQPFTSLEPEFFDLIIVDECHRGSASQDSEWRQILEYFHTATQIGMTATPKETKKISNIDYFGEPIYTYSLKDGIKDGFLAPYKVIRIGIDKDLMGYRPEKGKKDKNGNLIEDREYNVLDFDKNIILEKRRKLVAKKITEFLKKTDRFSKTIVFCVDTEHADAMRHYLINENSDLVAEDERYIMRITGNDTEGKRQLDYFISNNEKYPTIVTTSKLLTTGVDCKTCKLIVLDANINSMTEFKQIIGRGTRIEEKYGKNHFTILDFRNNSRKFVDPEFDGEPISVADIDIDKPISTLSPKIDGYKPPNPKPKINDVDVNIILEQNQCYDSNGNLITENLINYSKNKLIEEYNDLNTFLSKWTSEMKRNAIIDELYQHDIFLDELREAAGNKDIDDFDLICHIAFDKKPLTRQERANNVKKRGYLNKYEGIAKQVINGLIDKYASDGIEDIENIQVLDNEPFRNFGSPIKIVKAFGGKNNLLNAMHDLKRELFI